MKKMHLILAVWKRVATRSAVLLVFAGAPCLRAQEGLVVSTGVDINGPSLHGQLPLYVAGSFVLRPVSATEIIIIATSTGFGSQYGVDGYPNIAAEYDVGIYDPSLNYTPNLWGIQGNGGVPWVPPFFSQVDNGLNSASTFSENAYPLPNYTNGTTSVEDILVTGPAGRVITIAEMGYFWEVPGVDPFHGANPGALANTYSYTFGSPVFTKLASTGPIRDENPAAHVADPVNVTTGEFYQDAVDLHVNGPLPIEVRRTFSSQNPAVNEFGFGWLSGYPCYLIPSGATITATDLDGSVVIFRQNGTGAWRPTAADNPCLWSPTGGIGNLFKSYIVSNGGSYVWTMPDGSQRTYSSRTYGIGTLPYLQQITDSRNNYLSFAYGTNPAKGSYGQITQITSSNGTQVSFAYNPQGLLTQAVSGDGRSVTYVYSYYGDLKQVTLPDGSGYWYSYGLDANQFSTHQLQDIVYPNSRQITNVYDSSNRVTQQQLLYSDGSDGEGDEVVNTATFDYSIPGETTVTDVYGRPTRYFYSLPNQITLTTDPLGFSIAQAWYTSSTGGGFAGSTQSITDKRGLTTSYQYDGSGNAIATSISGNLTGSGGIQAATATAQYNAINEPIERTDFSGITTSYSYGDTRFPHLPTQIATSKGGAVIRQDQLTYGVQEDPVNPTTLFSSGLLASKVTSAGTPDQATTSYSYNTAGSLVQETSFTGNSDPSVVENFTYTLANELASVTDGDNRVTRYTYDGMSRPLTKSVFDQYGNQLGAWYTSYDGLGNVTSVNGPRSSPTNAVTTTYDGLSHVTSIASTSSQANSSGHGIVAGATSLSVYGYDLFGDMAISVDPNGNTTSYGYDGLGQVVSVTTAGTRTESYVYDGGGDVVSYVNPLGGTTLKSYTSTGELLSQQNPDGSLLQWRYNPDGRIQQEILTNGSTWTTTYDDFNRVVTRVLTSSTQSVLATETSAFDRRGNLTSLTDSDGFLKSASYDGLSRLKLSSGPSGVAGSAQQVVSYVYGASAMTMTSTNALGEATVLTSDALGRPLQLQAFSSSGSSVRLTTYAYVNGNTATTRTDGSGAGAIATTVYTDDAGRVLLTIHGDGTFEKNAYDLNENLVASTDSVGNTTSFAYNGLNQRISQTLPDGTVTNFSFDPSSNLLNRSMAGGSLDLIQTFDSEGRRLTEKLFSSSATTRQFSYSYYPANNAWAGRLQSVVGPRSTSTISYDSFLRPQNITMAGALAETNISTVYSYDNRGLVTSISQNSVNNAAGPATQLTRTYDGYGKILNEVVTSGGSSMSNVSQTWDAAGRRSTLNEAGSTLPSPLFAYQNLADGHVSQVTADNVSYGFSYADNGLLTARTNPFRTVSIGSRDAQGRVLQQTNAVAGATAMQETMTWRANSTVSNYSVNRVGLGSWNESRAYAYNSRGQLVSEGASPAAGNPVTMAYTFDGNSPGMGVRVDAKEESGALVPWESSAASVNSLAQVSQDLLTSPPSVVPANGVSLGADHVNIVVDGTAQGQATFAGSSDPVGAWSINLSLAPGAHTLTANAIHPSGLYTATVSSTFTVAGTPSGSVTSAYDGDANVVSRTWASGLSQTLTWDAFGRLIKVVQLDSSSNGYNWSAIYDPLGRRIQTTQQPVVSGSPSGLPSTTSSIYDSQVEFLEIGVSVNGAKAWKVYGPDLNGRFGSLQGTGGLEATILDAGGTTQGVINDQFGNGVASVTGSTVSWFATRVGAYGPLPGTQAATLSDITQLAAATAWRGRRIDPTGFYDLGARYYEPTSGRFLSADPLGQASSPSLYDIAGGDPVNFFDPTGRCKDQTNTNNWGQNPADPRNTANTTGYTEAQVAAILAAGKASQLNGGYLDGFGNHESFCMSCHDPTDPGAQLQMAMALNATIALRTYTDLALIYASGGLGAFENAAETANLSLDTATTWGRAETLADHFARHGADFGAQTADEYANMASQFLQDSQRAGLPTKIDSQGVIRIFDQESGAFGSFNPDGTTRTFFKPGSPNYFDRQPGTLFP
jgi:RHS repeat-associated protein